MIALDEELDMGQVLAGAFVCGILGLFLGLAFGKVGGGNLAQNQDFFTHLAALVGWAAGGVIGAVGVLADVLWTCFHRGPPPPPPPAAG